MNRSRIFTDNEIQGMQQKRERDAKYFAQYTAAKYLLDTAEQCNIEGSIELALAHHQRLHKENEEIIAKLQIELAKQES